MSLKVKWGFIPVKNLEMDRSKSFALSISLETKPIGVSLESPRLENIPQAPGNRTEVGENHGARRAVSATL